MNEFLTIFLEYFAEFVFAVVSLIIAKYLIPCIKNDIIPWLKDKHLYTLVRQCVQAAEKISESNEADFNKKDWVIHMLNEKGITVDETTEMLIESAVKELDIAIGQIEDAFIDEYDIEK